MYVWSDRGENGRGEEGTDYTLKEEDKVFSFGTVRRKRSCQTYTDYTHTERLGLDEDTSLVLKR